MASASVEETRGQVSEELPPSPVLEYSYTRKDAILFALSLHTGGTQDHKYTWEEDPGFSVHPLFVPLAGPFGASKGAQSLSFLTSFPPIFYRTMGLIPPKLFLTQTSLPANTTVLHISQSVAWGKAFPVPESSCSSSIVSLRGRFVSVIPKSVGTFVTTETAVRDDQHSLCATLQSTVLVLGVTNVRPYHCHSQVSSFQHDEWGDVPLGEETVMTIPSHQALLYRLASGDTNRIHVVGVGDHDDDDENGRPLLHGSCTLGLTAQRFLSLLSRETNNTVVECRHLTARFVAPVYISASTTTLKVQFHRKQEQQVGEGSLFCENDSSSLVKFLFRVIVLEANEETVVINHGHMVVHLATSGRPLSHPTESTARSHL